MEKFERLQQAFDILNLAKEKDIKLFKYIKKQHEKKVEELNFQLNQMEQVIREKDREIKMQALKLKDIFSVEKKQRTNLIKSEFKALSKLASPDIHRRGLSQISEEKMVKLDK